MKHAWIPISVLCILYSGFAFAYSSGVLTALKAVEQGVQEGSAEPFDYVLGSNVTVQIADTIWQVSGSQATGLLNSYFCRMDSIQFQMKTDMNWGVMKYKIDGKWDEAYVIVGIRNQNLVPEVTSIRIVEKPYKATYVPGRL
jgi:hypothetical protein